MHSIKGKALVPKEIMHAKYNFHREYNSKKTLLPLKNKKCSKPSGVLHFFILVVWFLLNRFLNLFKLSQIIQ